MSRKIRHLPREGALAEVTVRTIQERHLLRPADEVNEIIIGVFVRALELYPVELVGIVFMSNHFHAIVKAHDVGVLSRFMCFVNGNLAREVGRLHGWKQKFWGGRYRMIPISDEEAAQVARLKYLLSHGAKEGLVACPLDWPGVHCAASLLTGIPMQGRWLDRTAAYKARQRDKSASLDQFSKEGFLHFEKLPCWAHMVDEEYRREIAHLLDEIRREAADIRRCESIPLRSRRKARRALCRINPRSRPASPKQGPAPFCHASTRGAREELRQAYRHFVDAYRAAASALRQGNADVTFPEGCFPPGLPFVPIEPRPAGG